MNIGKNTTDKTSIYNYSVSRYRLYKIFALYRKQNIWTGFKNNNIQIKRIKEHNFS